MRTFCVKKDCSSPLGQDQLPSPTPLPSLHLLLKTCAKEGKTDWWFISCLYDKLKRFSLNSEFQMPVSGTEAEGGLQPNSLVKHTENIHYIRKSRIVWTHTGSSALTLEQYRLSRCYNVAGVFLRWQMWSWGDTNRAQEPQQPPVPLVSECWKRQNIVSTITKLLQISPKGTNKASEGEAHYSRRYRGSTDAVSKMSWAD